MAKQLNHGDFFGDADLLHVVGYSFFGDIIATTDVELMYIPAAKFNKIPLFEQMEMKELAKKRQDI